MSSSASSGSRFRGRIDGGRRGDGGRRRGGRGRVERLILGGRRRRGTCSLVGDFYCGIEPTAIANTESHGPDAFLT